MLRRVGVALALLVTLVAATVGLAPPAAAVTDVQSGYWQQAPGPAQVPPDGLDVASNATGPQAVSAVRFTLAPGESAPSLTVKVAQSRSVDQVAILACPATAASAGWTPPKGAGSFADAPKGNCTAGSTKGSPSADGTTMRFDLGLLPANGTVVDVVLQPDTIPSQVSAVPGTPSQQNPTFDVAFQPVTARAVTVTQSPSRAFSPAPGSIGGPGENPAPRSSGLGAPLPAAAGVAPPGPAVAPAPVPAATPVVAPTDGTRSGAAAAPAAFLITKKRNWRLIFAIGMIAADVLLAVLYIERRGQNAGERRPLSIYDPPPAAVTAAAPAAPR